MREYPKNRKGSRNPGNRTKYSSVAPPERAGPRGSNSGTGGGAHPLYAITSLCEQQISLDVFTNMINFFTFDVFTFDVYALLDLKVSLSFVTPYIEYKFQILLEKLCEPFYVVTPIRESILAGRVYCDFSVSINHKNTMDEIVELDMVDSDVFYVWIGFMRVVHQ